MEQSLTVQTERIDDLPVLLCQLEKMGIPSLLDHHFPVHGNWQGLSLGQVVSVWLCHILTEGDHCLEHVRPWVGQRLESLRILVGEELSELDFSDDRLANILTILSDWDSWEKFEKDLNQRVLRVFDLESFCIRHDSTTSSSFRSVGEEISSLFQLGHSKDHRPDLPQLKVMLASLDPMGMPLATEVLPGNWADDPLYVSSIKRVQESLESKGLLHVGDSKMSSTESRAYIVFSGDVYLCPLSRKQFSEEQLQNSIQAALADEEDFSEVYRTDAKGKRKLIARGFEQQRAMTAETDGVAFGWKERLFIVRSSQHTERSEQALLKRLQKAQNELEKLNERGRGKRRPKNREDLNDVIKKIINHRKSNSFLEVTIEEIVTEQKLRAHKERPATVRQHWDFRLSVTRNQANIDQQVQSLGWQVYATPLLPQEFSLEQAVLCYRNEFRVEHNFSRIKGPLSLRPMYLAREDRIEGLVHLLSIALRPLSLVEFKVREELEKRDEPIQGLYPGNPKRATSRPTTEKLLQAFKEVNLTVIRQPQQTLFYLNDLSQLQIKILDLMGLSPDCYYRLRDNFSNST